jgi:glycosyltransferase involved in cell wall biosynthesis
MRSNMPTYVLITPARNEEAYIERTIKAVVAQTALPRKWIIVSDGSTDRTDDIVKKYLQAHSWIELIRMPEHRDRHFAAKVTCFNAGYEIVKNTEYDIIGSLDADITFEPDYFEFLLGKFADTPHLGVAGTPFVEGSSSHYDYRFTNIEHVSGACQMFKRECFADIGGYIPIKEDEDVYREDVPPSSQYWNRQQREADDVVQTRPQGLLFRRTSPLAGLQVLLSHKKKTLSDRRIIIAVRIPLGDDQERRPASSRGADHLPQAGADATVEKNIFTP